MGTSNVDDKIKRSEDLVLHRVLQRNILKVF